MIWEALLLALSLYKSAQQVRAEEGTPHLMVVLLRDSVLYFGGALATILSNFIIWKSEVRTVYRVSYPRRIDTNSAVCPSPRRCSLLLFRQCCVVLREEVVLMPGAEST